MLMGNDAIKNQEDVEIIITASSDIGEWEISSPVAPCGKTHWYTFDANGELVPIEEPQC